MLMNLIDRKTIDVMRVSTSKTGGKEGGTFSVCKGIATAAQAA